LSDLSSALTPMLNDHDWRVRAAAAEGLKRLKMQTVITSLSARLELESHPVVQSAIERALQTLSSLS